MEVEFIEQGHIYLVDGVITPSVSEILQFIFPDKYKGIPQRILADKAQFGTNIHKAIENHTKGLEISLTDFEKITFEQYLKLKEKHNINPVKLEETVNYGTRYSGRLDMIADVNYYRCLIDIKTTAKVDEESLAWQLGMYKLAYPEKIERCYCLWLPKKDLGRLIEIQPKTKEQILKKLDEYEEYLTKR